MTLHESGPALYHWQDKLLPLLACIVSLRPARDFKYFSVLFATVHARHRSFWSYRVGWHGRFVDVWPLGVKVYSVTREVSQLEMNQTFCNVEVK